jgi:hypothetical protein
LAVPRALEDLERPDGVALQEFGEAQDVSRPNGLRADLEGAPRVFPGLFEVTGNQAIPCQVREVNDVQRVELDRQALKAHPLLKTPERALERGECVQRGLVPWSELDGLL